MEFIYGSVKKFFRTDFPGKKLFFPSNFTFLSVDLFTVNLHSWLYLNLFHFDIVRYHIKWKRCKLWKLHLKFPKLSYTKFEQRRLLDFRKKNLEFEVFRFILLTFWWKRKMHGSWSLSSLELSFPISTF